MAIVLIGGGTGLVGMRLSELLAQKNYEVRHLSRTPDLNATFPQYHWDTATGTIDPAALEGVTYAINLAGAGIADKRWTAERKKLIIESRTQTTNLFKQAIAARTLTPKAFLSASAIGYYGDRADQLMTEESSPGTGFLTDSVLAWEDAVDMIAESGVRTVKIRIGIVLSTNGGAMPQLTQTFPLGTGAYFGNGKAWYSWIHIDDLCRIFIHALENDTMYGVYNGVAPQPRRIKNLVKDLEKAYETSLLILPAPAFGLRLVFGEMADTILNSTKVSNKKIQDTNFSFHHPELVAAVKDLRKRGL